VCLYDSLLAARMSWWDSERQNLRRRRKEAGCDATRGLIQCGRQHRHRRRYRFDLRGIVKHIAMCTLNDPTVDARTGKPHTNCAADLGLVDELVRNDVVERPIHVRQIDVNEHAGGLRKAGQLFVLIFIGGGLYFASLAALGFRPRHFKRPETK